MRGVLVTLNLWKTREREKGIFYFETRSILLSEQRRNNQEIGTQFSMNPEQNWCGSQGVYKNVELNS